MVVLVIVRGWRPSVAAAPLGRVELVRWWQRLGLVPRVLERWVLPWLSIIVGRRVSTEDTVHQAILFAVVENVFRKHLSQCGHGGSVPVLV